MTTLRWTGSVAPRFGRRVLVAAPHPDDEILGCAGIMTWLDGAGVAVEVLAVTDGDASHALSTRITPATLVTRRAKERKRALATLDLGHVPVHRLHFADGAVAARHPQLLAAIRSHLDAESTLIVPWRSDGHPDHEAVARAGLAAAVAAGAACFEVPIWARVRGHRCVPTHVLELGSLRDRKRAAVAEFESQLAPLGPEAVDGPVVHPDELQQLTSDTELIMAGS